MDDIANIPAEFAPVLKGLSTVLTMHGEGNCRRRMPTTTIVPTKSRRNTVSGAVNADVSEEIEEAENPSFPLAEHYPFTLLHKLSAGKLFSSFFFLYLQR